MSPDQSAAWKLLAGSGTCASMDRQGYCAGDTWVRCDETFGLVPVPCGAGQCHSLGQPGASRGACLCGARRAGGDCSSVDRSAPGDWALFHCQDGVLAAEPCRAEIGLPNAMCGTTLQGNTSTSACMCDVCTVWRPNGDGGGSCVPACPGVCVPRGGVSVCL